MPTPEELKRWSRAVNNTYQAIGSDANLEGEKGWVILQCCLDADHTRAYGDLELADYEAFQTWYREFFTKYGYEPGLKRLAKILNVRG